MTEELRTSILNALEDLRKPCRQCPNQSQSPCCTDGYPRCKVFTTREVILLLENILHAGPEVK